MKYVVVEDEIRIREGVEKLIHKLSSEADEIRCAENGKEGLALLQKFKPDLIVTDIRMPEMDGLSMLAALKNKGALPRTIILSAYSEFEYARTAIQLGVSDYVLKPISVVEFTEAFKKNIRAIEIEKEENGTESEEGSLDMILNNMLHSDFLPDTAIRKKLEKNYGLRANSLSSLCLIYAGDRFEEKKDEYIKMIQKALQDYNQTESYIWLIERERTICVLFYNYDSFSTVERWLQRQLLSGFANTLNENFCTGIIELNEFENMKSAYETLGKNLKWNITLGKGVLVSYPKIEKIHTVPITYPTTLEQDMREYLCTMNTEKIEETGERFIEYFSSGGAESVIHPRTFRSPL